MQTYNVEPFYTIYTLISSYKKISDGGWKNTQKLAILQIDGTEESFYKEIMRVQPQEAQRLADGLVRKQLQESQTTN